MVPSHGAMYVLQGHPGAQYCPDQSHDGVWTEGGRTPATRRLWPVGYRSFAEAVAQHEAAAEGLAPLTPLPTLDIGELLNA